MIRILRLPRMVATSAPLVLALLLTGTAAAANGGPELLNPSNPHLRVLHWFNYNAFSSNSPRSEGQETICIFHAPPVPARALEPGVLFLCPTLLRLSREATTSDVSFTISEAPDKNRFLTIQAQLWPQDLFRAAYNSLSRVPSAPSPRTVEPLPLDWFKVVAFVRGNNGKPSPAPFLQSSGILRRDVRTGVVDISFPLGVGISRDEVNLWMDQVEFTVSAGIRGSIAYSQSSDALLQIDAKQILRNFPTDAISRPTRAITYTNAQEERVVGALAIALKTSASLVRDSVLPAPVASFGEIELSSLAALLLQKSGIVETAAFDPSFAFENRAWTATFHAVQDAFTNATSAVGSGFTTRYFLDESAFYRRLSELWENQKKFRNGYDEACDGDKYGLAAPFKVMAWTLALNPGHSRGPYRCSRDGVTSRMIAGTLAQIFHTTVNDKLGESIRVAFRDDFGLIVNVPGLGSPDRHLTIMRLPANDLPATTIEEFFAPTEGVVPLSYANYVLSHTFSARSRASP